MLAIQKKILTDENMQPLAVQIDYADWLKIEQLLLNAEPPAETLSALKSIQEAMRRYIPADRCLSDELIAERRREAENE